MIPYPTIRDPAGAGSLGACLSIPREPRWLGEGADARRAAQDVASATAKPRNTADAPHQANPEGPGRFRFIHRCRLLIGCYPTASAPPRLKRNLPRSRPRGILRQAPMSNLSGPWQRGLVSFEPVAAALRGLVLRLHLRHHLADEIVLLLFDAGADFVAHELHHPGSRLLDQLLDRGFRILNERLTEQGNLRQELTQPPFHHFSDDIRRLFLALGLI